MILQFTFTRYYKSPLQSLLPPFFIQQVWRQRAILLNAKSTSFFGLERNHNYCDIYFSMTSAKKIHLIDASTAKIVLSDRWYWSLDQEGFATNVISLASVSTQYTTILSSSKKSISFLIYKLACATHTYHTQPYQIMRHDDQSTLKW